MYRHSIERSKKIISNIFYTSLSMLSLPLPRIIALDISYEK